VYEARSPINHLDRFDTPLIVFQGLDDKVVPPRQSEMIVEALRARGVDCEYHAYEGEGHGFRRAETIVDQMDAELAFYRRVLRLGDHAD
jgi:dipeptidyl aminopeptidase/acylaminoacyl peptidase